MPIVDAEADLRPMRETDYLTRHVDVAVPQLGPDVSCWHAGPGIPPLFIERSGPALGSLDAFDAWLAQHRPVIDDLIFTYGGVLFRGFPVASGEDYARLMRNFPRYEPGYVAGMSPRKAVVGDVLESTRLDENFKIGLHSEMAYMKRWPPRISLFCKTPSPVGGETIIGSMDEFMKRMPEDLRRLLEEGEYRVVRNFSAAGSTRDAVTVAHPDLIGWDDAFFTEDPAEVERQCAKLGIDFTWNADGSITLKEVSPALTNHPRDGKRYYRSNLHTNHNFETEGFREIVTMLRERQAEPSGHYLGDRKLTHEEADTINAIYEQIELAWPWQSGDVVILDNLKVAHGRNPYSGPREVLVQLLDA